MLKKPKQPKTKNKQKKPKQSKVWFHKPVVLGAFIIPDDLSFPASAQVPRTVGTRFRQPAKHYQWPKWQLWWEAHQGDWPPRTSFMKPQLVKSTAAGLRQETFHPASTEQMYILRLTSAHYSFVLFHPLPAQTLPPHTPPLSTCR